MNCNFNSGVKQLILLPRGCAKHFIGQANFSDVKHVRNPKTFYCKTILLATHFIAEPVLVVLVHFKAWGTMHKSQTSLEVLLNIN